MTFLRYSDNSRPKLDQFYATLRIPVFRAALNLTKFQAVSICRTKQCIDMKLSLKIYLTSVLIILKEQLFGGFRL